MCTRCVFLSGVAAFSVFPLVSSAKTGDPQALELAMPRMQRVSDTVWLGQLTDGVWVHTTTYKLENVGYYPANGVIAVGENESVLIDTGWTPEQTEVILAAWNTSRRPPIAKALVTHFHFDRLGGIPALEKHGVPTYGNPLTIGLAIDRGFTPPKAIRNLDRQAVRFGALELYRPGSGHTVDNTVVWIARERVLFGGCLVKATTANDLGNMADGDIYEYPQSIRNLASRYSAKFVVPGHGTIAGDSLAHTLKLAMAGN